MLGLILIVFFFGLLTTLEAFAPVHYPVPSRALTTAVSAFQVPESSATLEMERRTVLLQFFSTGVLTVSGVASAMLTDALPASAKAFTAGGTLVDRDVGAQVGNPEASARRRSDNSNVLFDKDHYFKFGVAAPWIEPGNTDFPKTMPFTKSQQRYDALNKYGSRVNSGAEFLAKFEDAAKGIDFATAIPDPVTTVEYQLRPMGLLANSFLASENTGVTNELYLARWYINEVYLQLMDARSASSPKEATIAYTNAKKAFNSYLGMLNRVINAKVGDPFVLI